LFFTHIIFTPLTNMYHKRRVKAKDKFKRKAHLRLAPQVSTLCEALEPVAIYHCSIKPISVSGGKSGIAAAAYRAGECLEDKKTGEIYDYTRKQGIEHTELVLPGCVEYDRESLWNAAEEAEKRKDARVAREFEVALPAELTAEERRELAVDYAKSLVDKYGVAADVAIHEPNPKGDVRNYHAHIMITTREVDEQGFGKKTDLELSDKALREQDKPVGREQIKELRAEWAERCNLALERAGYEERVSHKSLKEQEIDREPTVHLGPIATEMERRGIQTDRGDINRAPERIIEAKIEIAVTEDVSVGVDRMKAQAREWQEAKEQALINEKAKLEIERQRQEQDREQILSRERVGQEQKIPKEEKKQELQQPQQSKKRDGPDLEM
jgi:ATP-dependent exoDNAse (exonuclease V) alpha subunit